MCLYCQISTFFLKVWENAPSPSLLMGVCTGTNSLQGNLARCIKIQDAYEFD